MGHKEEPILCRPVSNHGGRQLDGVLSTARALPAIVDTVGDDLTDLVDSKGGHPIAPAS